MANENRKSVVVSGELIWPFLVRKNEMADKYTVDIARLSKEDAKKLGDLGLTVKNEPKENPEFDRGLFVTVKSVYPIDKFTYRDGSKVSEETLEAVGNGTKVRVSLGTYETEFKKKKFVLPSLNKAVIVDLVKYDVGDSDDDELYAGLDDDGGFPDDEIPF